MSLDADKIGAQIKMFRTSCESLSNAVTQLADKIDSFEEFITGQVAQQEAELAQISTEAK